jgi:hypothetical protein
MKKLTIDKDLHAMVERLRTDAEQLQQLQELLKMAYAIEVRAFGKLRRTIQSATEEGMRSTRSMATSVRSWARGFRGTILS